MFHDYLGIVFPETKLGHAVLEELFKVMDINVDIKEEYNAEERQVEVDLSGDSMGMLIGKRGQTLDALQYLTSLTLNKGYDDYVKVKIDTDI